MSKGNPFQHGIPKKSGLNPDLDCIIVYNEKLESNWECFIFQMKSIEGYDDEVTTLTIATSLPPFFQDEKYILNGVLHPPPRIFKM